MFTNVNYRNSKYKSTKYFRHGREFFHNLQLDIGKITKAEIKVNTYSFDDFQSITYIFKRGALFE